VGICGAVTGVTVPIGMGVAPVADGCQVMEAGHKAIEHCSLLHLLTSLQDHVDQRLCVRLPGCYHLFQAGIEAEVVDSFLVTATSTVLIRHTRLYQLQRR